MAPSPRLSDRELAAINAAAVTKEYSVKPHLGELHWLGVFIFGVITSFFFFLLLDYRTVSAVNG